MKSNKKFRKRLLAAGLCAAALASVCLLGTSLAKYVTKIRAEQNLADAGSFIFRAGIAKGETVSCTDGGTFNFDVYNYADEFASPFDITYTVAVDNGATASYGGTLSDGTAYDNYDAISVTKYFFVYEIAVYASEGRQLRVLSASSSQSSAEIAKNGAATIFFASPRSEDPILYFSAPLPVGTKITLIEVGESSLDVLGYYYYTVKEENVTSLELASFKMMGSESYLRVAGNAYQVCFDFSAAPLSTSINVELWSNPATITAVFDNNAEFTSVTGAEGEITLSLNARGAYKKILTFIVSEDVNATLYRGGSSVNMLYGNGRVFCFEIGKMDSEAITSASVFTLKLTSDTGAVSAVSVDCYVAPVEEGVDTPYVTNSSVAYDTEENISVTNVPMAPASDIMIVELENSTDGIISLGNRMTVLNFKSNAKNASLTYSVKIKQNGEYLPLVNASSSLTTSSDGSFSLTLPSLSAYQGLIGREPKIIRITFRHGDTECNCNFIVVP